MAERRCIGCGKPNEEGLCADCEKKLLVLEEKLKAAGGGGWLIESLSIKQSDKISDIAIPCPNEDCCGCLKVKEFIDRPTCNECGTVYVLVKE